MVGGVPQSARWEGRQHPSKRPRACQRIGAPGWARNRAERTSDPIPTGPTHMVPESWLGSESLS